MQTGPEAGEEFGASPGNTQRGGELARLSKGAEHNAGSIADMLLVSCVPWGRTAWSELWKLTQARGQQLRDAEVMLRVQRDLSEALTQIQVCEPRGGRGFFLEVDPPQAVLHLPFLILWAIPSPQEKASSLPSDLAQDLCGLEAQLRRHKGLEHELVGTERQVS